MPVFTQHYRCTTRLARAGQRALTLITLLAVGLLADGTAAQARLYPHGRHRAIAVPAVLPAAVEAARLHAHLPLSSIAVVVERIGDPTPILSVNADAMMSPASTMKLITTYAGLSILGPAYRWRTQAYATGPVVDGTLQGDLYIKGSGDPKLVPEELIDLVDRIHRAGITHIAGDLVLDKSYFAASTLNAAPLDDEDEAPYNVGPDPLLYAFKAVTFTLAPSDDGQVSIDVDPPLAQLRITDNLRASPGPCSGALRAAVPALHPQPDGELDAVFEGNYPLRCATRSVNIALLDHSSFFAGGFLALWRQTGGTFTGHTREASVPAQARTIASHDGPVLADVVHDINKFSNNVMARNLFLTIGAEVDRPPATAAKSILAIRDWLHKNGIAAPRLVLDNGSGLSRSETISAMAMATLLQQANASPVAQVFVASLPTIGVDGTMQHRLSREAIAGNGHIKTGTLSNVRAIAGYVAAANGQSYVVVSFINDPRAGAGRAVHDRLLEWVYRGAR